MNNQKTSTLLRLILTAAMATPLIAASAEPTIKFNASEEKKDVVLTLNSVGVAKLLFASDENGLVGFTNDFKGKRLAVMAVFAEPISKPDRTMLMRAGNGRTGTVQCKRVRVGESPEAAIMKTFVMAEGCAMIKFQNT